MQRESGSGQQLCNRVNGKREKILGISLVVVGVIVLFMVLSIENGSMGGHSHSDKNNNDDDDDVPTENGMGDDDWWRWGVVYQIYPRSFQDSDGDGVGDLKGILSRVDYLDELGIQAVWLNPIFPSPMADFGYDIENYTGIYPLFGTMDDFDALVKALHKRKIKVLLDFVPNHSSDQHPWFIASRDGGKTGAKRDWYIWHDGKADGSPPNNWISRFGGPAWRKPDGDSQYYFHHFLTEQPDLNFSNPEVIAAFKGVLDFWFDRGVDGFRVDALTSIFEDPQFRDEPPSPTYRPGIDDPFESLLHIYTENVPPIHKVVSKFREFVDAKSKKSSKILICETYMDYDGLMKYYGCDNPDLQSCEKECQLPFNFRLLQVSNPLPPKLAYDIDRGDVVAPYDPISAKNISNSISDYLTALRTINPQFVKPGGVRTPNWVLGNHDQRRLASPSRFGLNRARIAHMLLLSLPGAITTYYGDEIGMQDVTIPVEKEKDPRGPGLGRDPERTPMQWDWKKKNAGFTTNSETWLPMPTPSGVDVKTQNSDSQSLLSLFKALTELRVSDPSVAGLGFSLLNSSTESVISYLRYSDPLKPPTQTATGDQTPSMNRMGMDHGGHSHSKRSKEDSNDNTWKGTIMFIGNLSNNTAMFHLDPKRELGLSGVVGKSNDWKVVLHSFDVKESSTKSLDLTKPITLSAGEGYILRRS